MPADEAAQPAPNLVYGVVFRRRRLLALVVTAVVVGIVIALISLNYRRGVDALQEGLALRRCWSFAGLGEKLVYVEENNGRTAADASQLPLHDGSSTRHFISPPACFARFAAGGVGLSRFPIFAGALKPPGGSERLIYLEAPVSSPTARDPPPTASDDPRLFSFWEISSMTNAASPVLSFDPFINIDRKRQKGFTERMPHVVRYFGGMRSETDPSVMYFVVEIDSERVRMRCQLLDNQTLRITPETIVPSTERGDGGHAKGHSQN